MCPIHTVLAQAAGSNPPRSEAIRIPLNAVIHLGRCRPCRDALEWRELAGREFQSYLRKSETGSSVFFFNKQFHRKFTSVRMDTEDKHLLLTKLPVDTLGAGPKFTQTLGYLKLNCRPAWLPLEKHFMHLLRGGGKHHVSTTPPIPIRLC